MYLQLTNGIGKTRASAKVVLKKTVFPSPFIIREPFFLFIGHDEKSLLNSGEQHKLRYVSHVSLYFLVKLPSLHPIVAPHVYGNVRLKCSFLSLQRARSSPSISYPSSSSAVYSIHLIIHFFGLRNPPSLSLKIFSAKVACNGLYKYFICTYVGNFSFFSKKKKKKDCYKMKVF